MSRRKPKIPRDGSWGLPLTIHNRMTPEGRVCVLFIGRVPVGRFSLRTLTDAVTLLHEGEAHVRVINPLTEEGAGHA